MGNPILVNKTVVNKQMPQKQINASGVSAATASLQVPDSILLYKKGKPLRIMVNPGHGEQTYTKKGIEVVATGARRAVPNERTNTTYKIAGYNREFSNDTIYEMNLNDSVAQRVSKNLKKYGAHVIYADNLTLEGIRKMQKDSCANSLISIHHNTNDNPKIKGSATYALEQSAQLATAINNNLKTDSTTANLGVKTNPAKSKYILKKSKEAVLVECEFMSNPEQLKKITTPEYFDTQADNITNGLLDYYLEPPVANAKKIHHKKAEKKPEKYEIKMLFNAKPKQKLCIYPPYSLYQN